jgi:RNA polymerase sigma-70 factor (sigma-E family)
MVAAARDEATFLVGSASVIDMWTHGGRPAPVATAPDPEAADFGYLFETHHKELFRLALLLTGGDRSLAEEAVSHAFVATLPKWRKGEVLDAVPYLRRAVANQVYGTFRRRRLERLEFARRDNREPTTQGESVVDDRDVLWSALRLLPPKQRTTVVLRFYLDLSELEAARVLEVSVGTVKSQTARGLAKLRQALGGLDV